MRWPDWVDPMSAALHRGLAGESAACRRREAIGRLAALVSGGAVLGLGFAGCAQPGAGLSASQPARAAQGPAEARADYLLVNRATWGATDTELERVRRLGLKAWVREQLQAPSDDRLPEWVQQQIDGMSISRQNLPALMREVENQRREADTTAGEEPRRTAQARYQRELTRLAREAAARHLWRAQLSPHQLRERMVWFWLNHFNVHMFKAQLRVMVGDYENDAIRPQALGRFRDLLGAVVHHPAMLRYLDNDQNAGGRINENLARELLELHTLGVQAGYSQRDVQEVARVLTGNGVNLSGNTPRLRPEQSAQYFRHGLYEFNPARHDFGDKTVLGQAISGRGARELDQVLDLLAAHPATARFLAQKIAVYFLSDDPPSALVDRMATAFTASGGEIGALLETLLLSPEFVAPEVQKFKDPMQFVVSAVRAAYDDRPVLNTGPMMNWLNRLGQGLYNRQTPDGYPSTAAAWNGSGQLAVRFEIARQIGSNASGLFKPEDMASGREQPGFPQLARPWYYQALRPQLRDGTRQALAAAATPQEWNTLLLSSPEFMYR